MSSTFVDNIKVSMDNFWNVRDEFKSSTQTYLRQLSEANSYPYYACALNIEGDLNIGAMIRTAHLLGCRKFFVFGRRRIDNRSLVGADKYINLTKVDGLNDQNELCSDQFENFLTTYNIRPVFVEHGGQSLMEMTTDDWETILNHSIAPCFVFGNERTGVPTSFLKDRKIITIPQSGVLRSFNVATSSSILLWEVYKQFQLTR